MATPSTGAQGTYADVTGVVNATAASEIVALLAELESMWTQTEGQAMDRPDFNLIPKHVSEKLSTELAAVAAAIAAAPTA